MTQCCFNVGHHLRRWVNVESTSVPKTSFISYSCICYFGHACQKINLVIIYLLTGKWATQNLKKHTQFMSMNMLTSYGHIKEPDKNDDCWYDCVAFNISSSITTIIV